MHSARHLMLIDICIKFREYSLSGFQVIERTRFVTDRQTDRQTDRRTDRRPGKNDVSPDPEGGRHNKMFYIFHKLFCLVFRLAKFSLNLFKTSFFLIYEFP